MSINRYIIILINIIIWLHISGSLYADRIFLKDGSVEETERVWLSDHFVHFILKGTSSIEVRYSKKIVERIEKEGAIQSVIPKLNIKQQDQALPDSDIQSGKAPNNVRSDSKSIVVKRDLDSQKQMKILRESKGAVFYNPRRSRRYWVTKTLRYNNLQSAINKLAELYYRTPGWVERYMGDENELETIHHNLSKQLAFEKSPQYVDNGQNQNQNSVKVIASKEPKQPKTESNKKKKRGLNKETIYFPKLNIDKDTKFYDPRRSAKYWTGKMTHHRSLSRAIKALADQYDVTPKWIEDHMGETNALIEIHQNIRKSLGQVEE